ncbi:hypothetical protein CR513_04366, partial [Mucuna pruriens]
MVNEVGVIDNLSLENQLIELTSLIRQLVITIKVCGICTLVEHPIDMFPTLQETKSDHLESVGSIAIWKAIVSAEFESRAICSPKIWIHPECTLESQQLSTAESEIPGTTIPTTTAIESATTRQLTIFRGLDEVVGNKKSGVPTKHEL